ncbi:SET domain-containing protein [Mollisia scopiformis]|uniref:SET domain-containing protein n=1 Tax=Mollisia scopiformis TaxID=149040 RepID=A0A194XCI1_MOLSC|nr:SET domain-containing protein [Mollisia scopiformis]KUJ17883.1 SET domain-containing protein [Mollisia scopiformis]
MDNIKRGREDKNREKAARRAANKKEEREKKEREERELEEHKLQKQAQKERKKEKEERARVERETEPRFEIKSIDSAHDTDAQSVPKDNNQHNMVEELSAVSIDTDNGKGNETTHEQSSSPLKTGMFASETLPKSAEIFREMPLIVFMEKTLNIEAAFNTLTDEKKRQYLAMKKKCDCPSEDNCTESDVIKVWNAVALLSFQSPTNASQAQVLEYTSQINHSCLPNASIFWNGDHEAVLYATQRILKGQQITRNYNPGIVGSTKVRREKLMEMYGFYCMCKACKENRYLSTEEIEKAMSVNTQPKETTQTLNPLSDKEVKTFEAVVAWSLDLTDNLAIFVKDLKEQITQQCVYHFVEKPGDDTRDQSLAQFQRGFKKYFKSFANPYNLNNEVRNQYMDTVCGDLEAFRDEREDFVNRVLGTKVTTLNVKDGSSAAKRALKNDIDKIYDIYKIIHEGMVVSEVVIDEEK